MAFEKGKSGNPSGRPKEDPELKELARTYTKEAIERLAFWMRSDNAKASVSACGVLLDRGYGKATQPISGDDDAPPIMVSQVERKIVRPNASNTDR